jgi:hypothetical protein
MKRKRDLEKWLEDDEARSRPYRAVRLDTLLGAFGSREEGALFWGGSSSFQAFVELRLAYIHGLYFATVLLALASIEQEIAGSLHAAGLNDAANMSLLSLLAAARDRGIITKKEFTAFNKLREVRNAYAHFRAPTSPTHVARRALAGNTSSDALLESDARQGLKALASFIVRRGSRPTHVPHIVSRRKSRA